MIWLLFMLLIFFLPFQNHYLVNVTIGGVTIFKLLGVVLFLFAFGRAAVRGMPNYLGSLPAKALFFFVTWRALSWVFAGQALAGLQDWTSYGVANAVSALLLLFITMVFVDSKDKLRHLLFVVVAGMGLAALYIIRDYLGGDDRPGWPFQDANYYALYAMSALPLALAVLGETKSKLARWGCYACIGLTVVGVILSASRAGFITLFLFGVIQVIRGQSRQQRVAVLAALLLCSFFVAPKAIQRLLNPTINDEESTFAHKAFAKAAFHMMLDHPLLGVGPSSAYFKAYIPTTGNKVSGIAHNTFLELGAESGVPALLAYLCLIGSCFFLLTRKTREFGRRGEIFLKNVSRGLQLGLFNSTLIGLSVSGSNVRFLWLGFTLIILLNQRRLILEPRREQAAGALPSGAVPHPFSTPSLDNSLR